MSISGPGTPGQAAFNTTHVGTPPAGELAAGRMADANSTRQASEVVQRNMGNTLLKGSESVNNANKGMDAALAQNEELTGRQGENYSMQQVNSLKTGLLEQATQMIQAIAKGIKAAGKAVADLTS
jgi:hypothetical protein